MNQMPIPTKRRLVQLASLLSQQTEKRITSKRIESLTGWSDSVIRRDILLLGYKGGVSNGYTVRDLYAAICEKLGIGTTVDTEKKCCIVGLGRLGAVLLEDSFLDGSPFVFTAGFDSNVNRTEILHSTFPLYPASKMEEIIEAQHIAYAVLAVPEKDAQKMAERLCSCGIKGIANYTATVLSVPETVAVENVSPVTALTNLAAFAAEKK